MMFGLFDCVINSCKRETKRSDRLVSSRMRFLCYIHYTFIVIGKVLYSIHGVYTGRDPQIPEIPKKRSTSSECKVRKWVWFGCTAAMCLKRVQSPHGNEIRMGITWRSPRRKGKPWSFFLAHELGN